jgi:hypothetical protein
MRAGLLSQHACYAVRVLEPLSLIAPQRPARCQLRARHCIAHDAGLMQEGRTTCEEARHNEDTLRGLPLVADLKAYYIVMELHESGCAGLCAWRSGCRMHGSTATAVPMIRHVSCHAAQLWLPHHCS